MIINTITSRWVAAGIHLAISLIVLGILLIVITQYWYPGVFIHIGGYQGIKIVAGVDIVLGPLLTLIIYNTQKKSLKFDLAAIATCQLLALSGGMYLVHNERPVIQLITDRGLEIITYSETVNHGITYQKPNKSTLPALLYLQLPDEDADINLARSAGEFLGEPLEYRSDLYQSVTQGLDSNVRRILSKRHIDAKSNCHWMPIISRHLTGDVCVSMQIGAIKTKLKP